MVKIYKSIPLALIFTFFFACFLLVGCSKHYEVREPQEKTPGKVVIKWTKVYGIDMDIAAELTTLEFREGKPKRVWASETYRVFKSVGYKHLGGEIIEEKIEGDKALVILQGKISTIAGGAKQKEFYLLKKVDGEWLIHDIKVKEEEVEEGKRVLGKEI